ncbi:MAG: HAMP domain-containing histidine kinase [Planctomycetes bacterium]|nr:HAMP domain-containing histidine kinase [Planctomycetota bacterium]
MPRLPVLLLPAAAAGSVFVAATLAAPAILTAALAAGATMLALRTATGSDTNPPGVDPTTLRRRKDDRLADTAHELRTPLTAVLTALEMLRENYAQTPEDRDAFLDQATVAARHMAFLINDVLDLAAIEAGRISLHVRGHAVADLLTDAQQVLGLTAGSRGLALKIGPAAPELTVWADRNRALQIVFNLVGNAVKFARSSVAIQAARNGERVRIAIADDGPGVPESRRDSLFTRFGRAHDDDQTPVTGTGLGLHLCRLLVEQMRGAIGHTPGGNGGAEFWFELPIGPPAACAAAEAQVSCKPQPGGTGTSPTAR